MTQDEIVELARQAGFDEHHAKFDTRIETFAKLIAAKEREACAKLCDDYGRAEEMQAIGNDFAEAIRAREQE